jgi:16S rRNA (uracil1498-N3)-methyltransferase
MSLPRFHVPEAAPGARLELPQHVAHHAREVLRLRPGAAAQVFDGQGNEYQATVEHVDRRRVTVHLGSALIARPEAPLRIVLALSTLRGDGMEWVVQKATELGVAEIRPLVTARTDSAARPALLGTRQERWEKVASGAAEQCGRAMVPSIAPTAHLEPLLAELFEGARLIFSATGGAGLRSLSAPTAVQILIGPPGGWDPIELEHAARAGFQAMSLGPRTLRTETAAIAAIAALLTLWSDLG